MNLSLKKMLYKILESLRSKYCYCNAVTATSITAVNTNTKLPITAMSTGNGFSYDATNKGVICNAAGKYAISAQVIFNTATSGDLMGASIFKNGTSLIGPCYARVGGTYDCAIIPPVYANLVEGDILTLYIRNNSSGRGQANALRFNISGVGGGYRLTSVFSRLSGVLRHYRKAVA